MGSIGSSKEIERGYYGISPTIGKQEVITASSGLFFQKEKNEIDRNARAQCLCEFQSLSFVRYTKLLVN
jgi:hypothetical protein